MGPASETTVYQVVLEGDGKWEKVHMSTSTHPFFLSLEMAIGSTKQRNPVTPVFL